VYCVCVFECNVYVGMFEEVGKSSNFWTVVSEGCPFFVVVFILCLVDFCFICTFSLVIRFSGKFEILPLS